METLYALIFVQGLIWGALLLKKSPVPERWLGLAFLVLGGLYFLEYSEGVYDFRIPYMLKFTCILFLFLMTGYYQYRSLALSESGSRGIAFSGLTLLLFLVFFQALIMPDHFAGSWLLTGITGILCTITDGFLLGRRIREKTHTGSILSIPNFILHFHILALKFLFTLILIAAAFGYVPGQGTAVFRTFLLQGFFAVVVFSTGYHAVQYSFLRRPHVKSRKRHTAVNQMVQRVIQLMEEKKPYLDCELTLGKVAEMLDISEHELTRLLHADMQTSFYDLINAYRIAAVKERLLQPESKKYTILSAAYESGFNSSSTFYRIFKENTGMQPREFIQRNRMNGQHDQSD